MTIYGMNVNDAYKFAQDRFNSADPGDAVQGFRVLQEIYAETKDRQYLIEILTKYKDSEAEADLPLQPNTVRRIAVGQNICQQFTEFRSGLSAAENLFVRSYLTGKTPEELRAEDAVAAERASRELEQQEAWRAQGLCYHCGGPIGLFKKCKSCGWKNK